ncbi:hypothetical protein J437_LFUL012222 [Ladona fulva]|uniref:Uncharacterized protein n=1 Tax=Ladona fulva TaxID=123851 RepID=A0A8K0P4Y4_LADFU|nr:hypothetical protein J437_LFUL012222 [Ladona fulva]
MKGRISNLVSMAPYSLSFLMHFIPISVGVLIPDLQIGYADYRDTAAFVSHKFPQDIQCESTGMKCLCNEKVKGYILHCEMEMHAELTDQGSSALFVHCNETMLLDKTRDIFRTMQLWRYDELEVQLKECPEESYGSLSPTEEQKPTITSLTIDCGTKKVFQLTKDHLFNHRGLRALNITCRALQILPVDLFAREWPSLRGISVLHTGVARIPEGLFSQLHSLESLMLQGNRIKSLGKESFVGLKSLKELRLKEHGLTSLEENVFHHINSLEYLEISHSKITKLPESIRVLGSLKILSVIGNSIKSIDSKECASLSNLDGVSIVNNSVTEIHSDCFSHLKNVKVIDISGNHLSELPKTATKMDRLQIFSLQHNSKPIAKVWQFLESESLMKMNMRNSSIEYLRPEMLHLLPNLTLVDLRDNKLRELDERFFAFNPKLQYVYLEGNKVSSIPSGFLLRNRELFDVKISRNNISSLPNIFDEYSSVVLLDLSVNNLKIITNSSLSNLRYLDFLSLSHNQIHSLANDSFRNVQNLRTLILEGNSLIRVHSSLFLPFEKSNSLSYLHLGNNLISSLSPLVIPSLKTLFLSNNRLANLERGVFHGLTALKLLILSNNRIAELPNSTLVTYEQELFYLDLSFNSLSQIPINAFKEASSITTLFLQGNRFQKFHWEWIRTLIELKELDLSENGLHFLDCNLKEFFPLTGLKEYVTPAVKILKLSDNDLSFNSSSWMFDKIRKTWGKVSPLSCFVDVEVSE